MKTTKLSRELKCGGDLLRKSGTQPQTRRTERPHHSLVRSLFCAHPVAFVSHEGGLKKKNQEKVLFSYIFTSTPFDSPPQPEKKRGKIQCLHAQIALVLQPAHYGKKQTNKTTTKKEGGRENVNRKLGTRREFVHVVNSVRIYCKSHNLGWLHQAQALVLSGLASLASASVALQRYRMQQHLHVSHVCAR